MIDVLTICIYIIHTYSLLWDRMTLAHKNQWTARTEPHSLLLKQKWDILASQHCVGLCCTTRGISYKHTHVPLGPLLHAGPSSHHLGHHRALLWAPCNSQQVLPAFWEWDLGGGEWPLLRFWAKDINCGRCHFFSIHIHILSKVLKNE